MRTAVQTIVLAFAVLFIFTCPSYAFLEGTTNTHVGHSAGVTEGDSSNGNTFIGTASGQNNKSDGGTGNTFVGYATGVSSNANYNTFLGNSAGYHNTTGAQNVFLGYYAGTSNDSGWNNVFIGYAAGVGYDSTASNTLIIDNCTVTSGSPNYYCTHPLIKGNFDPVQPEGRFVKIDGKLVFPSDERLKKDIVPIKSPLDKIMKLRGVSYTWKEEDKHGNGRYIGLLAQEVEKVLPELVLTDSDGYKSLSYDKLVPVLVEAIKEQQKNISEKSKIIDAQQIAIKALTERLAKLDSLENRLSRLESKDMSAQK
jgi:hypothetical protein